LFHILDLIIIKKKPFLIAYEWKSISDSFKVSLKASKLQLIGIHLEQTFWSNDFIEQNRISLKACL
jgi:hypothetical protein